ncbi:hypothetical protein QEZ52_06345 [Aliisedimentitalea scapharcae]|uniref:Uncharacterized protein n=1 Tax=Aliisedimentitalea scapharcae TaxID=1524259 RepID=A0ABZ2XZD3_9RHOB|nr:hypothetical protein K3727_06250 [Rhodobacteraceae bacterium M382]
MVEFNKSFELTVEDVELIEMALRKTMSILSRPDLDATLSAADGSGLADPQETLREISDLLGRMHNQKNFFRPRNDVYVGG